jgi:DNA-binding Lrp family transcriptional regulator
MTPKENQIGAYVLLRVMPGQEKVVYDRMAKLREVVSVNVLFGEWDLILGVSLDNVRELETFICDKIRTTKEVGLTSTMIVAR